MTLTFSAGPIKMMERLLKLPMTSLGTPLLVNIVLRKLAELPSL